MQNWESTLQSIQSEIPAPQFQRWFKQLAFLRQEQETLVVGVPSRFHQDWLNTHYKDQLNRAVQQNFGNSLQLEFEVLLEETNVEASYSSALSSPPPPITIQKPQLRVVEGGNSPSIESLPSDEFDSQIPQFNGEYFRLDYNRLCHQYSEIFAQGTNPHLNPLVITGSIGMGKTHLLAFLGKQLQRDYPHLKIRYTHAEKFTNEMFRSWNDKSGPNFQKFYRDEVDVLLFDDLHGLAGRRATQEALLHIYNEILSRGGRIVFTSSVLPHKLGEFLEPLRSRLLSGVSAEIKTPAYEEKLALLSLVAQQNQISVEESFLRVLADQGHQDIRELLGVLLRLHLQSQLEKKPLNSLFLSQQGLTFEAPSTSITLKEIIALVENSFAVSKTDLVSKSRKGLVVWARQVAMYLGRRFTLLSLEEIGKMFGRDHATVLYAYEKVSETLKTHPTRKYEVEYLIGKLQARLPKESHEFSL